MCRHNDFVVLTVCLTDRHRSCQACMCRPYDRSIRGCCRACGHEIVTIARCACVDRRVVVCRHGNPFSGIEIGYGDRDVEIVRVVVSTSVTFVSGI